MKNLETYYQHVPSQNIIMVELKGPFSSMNALDFKTQMMTTLRALQLDCYVDLREVNDFDLAALNTLVMMQRELERMGLDMVINTGESAKVRHLLSLTQMDQVLSIRA